MKINLTRLERFAAVYRHQSFSRAAEELAMTHSALTKSVQQLESELGTELFDRTTRKVHPSPAAHRLAKRAEELLAFSDQIVSEVTSHKRHIKLITGPAVIEASLGPALIRFHAEHPDVRVTAETMPPDIAVARLQRREVDALLYHSTTLGALPRKDQLRISPILDEPYVAVMRADHPARGTLATVEAMLAHKWAIPGFDRLFRAGIPAKLAEQYSMAGFPHYRVLSLATCASMAASSDLITLLPQGFAERHCEALGLITEQVPVTEGARYTVSAATLNKQSDDDVLQQLISNFGL